MDKSPPSTPPPAPQEISKQVQAQRDSHHGEKDIEGGNDTCKGCIAEGLGLNQTQRVSLEGISNSQDSEVKSQATLGTPPPPRMYYQK